MTPRGGHIVQYRNLRHPSPPKKVRRLLWTAPYMKIVSYTKKLKRQFGIMSNNFFLTFWPEKHFKTVSQIKKRSIWIIFPFI